MGLGRWRRWMEKAVERMDRRCQTEMLDLSLENMGQEEIELGSEG